MKKLLKMAFIAAAFFVTSCGKSDDGASINSKDLIGTWYLESVTMMETSAPLNDCNKQTNIVFTDTQISLTMYEGVANDCQMTKQTDTYRISRNTIITHDEAVKVSLSGNKLTFIDTENIDGNTVPITMVFVKR